MVENLTDDGFVVNQLVANMPAFDLACLRSTATVRRGIVKTCGSAFFVDHAGVCRDFG
jgi:hypothetical protein